MSTAVDMQPTCSAANQPIPAILRWPKASRWDASGISRNWTTSSNSSPDEPDLFDAFRETLVTAPYLMVEGILQNQQGAISVKLNRAEPLNFEVAEVPSHDFR